MMFDFRCWRCIVFDCDDDWYSRCGLYINVGKYEYNVNN